MPTETLPDWAQEPDELPDWAKETDVAPLPAPADVMKRSGMGHLVPSIIPTMQSDPFGSAMIQAGIRPTIPGTFGSDIQDFLREPGRLREKIGSAMVNVPEAVARATGLVKGTENIISPEGIGQRPKDYVFQPGESMIPGEPNAVKNLATPGLATLLTPAAPAAALSYLTDMAASIPDFWKEATDPGKTFEEKGRFITENLAPLAIPVLGHKLAPEIISQFKRSVLENPKSVQPLTQGVPSAIGQPKATEIYGNVRPQQIQSERQMSATESSGRIQPREEPSKQSNITENVDTEGSSQEITPAAKSLSEKVTAGERITNQDTIDTGLKLKSVSDLESLTAAAEGIKSQIEAMRGEKEPAKKMAMMNEVMKKNPQYLREAIEMATNTGSWVEGEGTLKKTYGERPLDWKKNPEVADWLRKNGERVGIALPEELKAEAPKLKMEETRGGDLKLKPALQTTSGEIIPGKSHNEIQDSLSPEKAKGVKRGYATPDGKFLNSLPEAVRYYEGLKAVAPVDNKTTISSVALDPQTGNPLSATDALVNKLETPSLQPSPTGLTGEVGKMIQREGNRVGERTAEPSAPPVGEPVTHNLGGGEPVAAAGPGGTIPSDVGTKPELAQLTDAVRTMAVGQAKPQLKRTYSLGEKLSQFKDAANRAVDGLKTVGAYTKMRLEGMPKWDGLKAAVGRRQLDLAESSATAREFADKALRAVPDAIDREAISNYVDTGGDVNMLKNGLAETKDIYKKGYERALNMTPEQKVLAENIKNYFNSRLNDGIEAGVLESGIEDYIHRTYEKDSPWKQGVIAELRSGVFTGKPALAKQRVFQYDFEAEKAGYKPVKDFVRRISEYDQSLNKSISDRRMVKEMMSEKMPDGRPSIDVAGVGTLVDGKGDTDPLLVKSQTKSKGETPKDNRADYIAYDHPALRKWKWINTDDAGKTTMLQGQVLIHPSALKQIKAVFGKSSIRQNPIGRAALTGSSVVKQTMLDLSGFHPVQITVHGWEHRTFKPVGKIDFENPTHRALISHGVVAGDAHGYEAFSEGLSGSSLSKHIPGLGPKLQAYNQWLFQDYIPRLKMAMAEHALERNKSRFSKELASGKMTEDQVLHLTANQANAAFGELNYEMMGRNKTVQDALRLGLLAPDFLEARGKFAAQAATKYGSEQRTALLLGAATLYLTARIINKQLDDQYHFEPANAFNVVYKGKGVLITNGSR